MEAEESQTDALKRRLRASLSESERHQFAALHLEMSDAVRSGGKSGDPLVKREAIVLMLARIRGHALDEAISQSHVLHLLEQSLARLEQDSDAATLETRIENLKRERVAHQREQDEWLAVYQRTASSLVMTVEGAREQYRALKEPYERLEEHTAAVEHIRGVITRLKLARDQLEAERRMVASQRVLEAAAMEKHSALVAYTQYFEEYNTDRLLLQYVRRRQGRDESHKEGRDDEAPRARKKKMRGDAHQLVSESLCLYRQGPDRMVKFIARDEHLLALYEQLANAEPTRGGGFMPVRRVERLDATQASQWELCSSVAPQDGAIMLETDALEPLFSEADGEPRALKHADRFAVLYELVYFMQQAARLLDGFQYGQRDARRLMWSPRLQARHYQEGSVVCASKMGVVMVELSGATQSSTDPLYLESTDYALFTELARTLTVPNFTHKLLALLGDQQRIRYGELLHSLATYWSERAFGPVAT